MSAPVAFLTRDMELSDPIVKKFTEYFFLVYQSWTRIDTSSEFCRERMSRDFSRSRAEDGKRKQ